MGERAADVYLAEGEAAYDKSWQAFVCLGYPQDCMDVCTVSDIANKALFIQVPITVHFYSRANSDLIPNHVQIFISARKFILFLEAVFIVILIRATTITGPN